MSLPSFSSSRSSSGSTMVGTWASRPAPTTSPMVCFHPFGAVTVFFTSQ